MRIHEDLASLGYEGGYDAVRRYARAWRRRRRLLSPSQAFVPLSFDPGEAYQFDWSHEYAVLSGATTRVKAAHMRLCYSRMQLVQIFPRESQEMVFEAHERAFRFFGGVCRRGIYDNMKTAVSTVFVGKKRDYPHCPGPEMAARAIPRTDDAAHRTRTDHDTRSAGEPGRHSTDPTGASPTVRRRRPRRDPGASHAATGAVGGGCLTSEPMGQSEEFS